MSTPDRSPDPGLQEAFGLTEAEYAILLGDGSDWEARVTQLCELSMHIVGHRAPDERAEFFRTPQKIGVGADVRYVPEHVPLDVAAEPGGLDRVVTAARQAIGRKLRNQSDAATPVPEAKRS